MELGQVLTIAAIFTSPAVALLVERWRRGADQRKRREYEVVYDLVRARAGTRSQRNTEMLERALNAIPIVFSGKRKVIDAHSKFYEYMASNPGSEMCAQKLIALILIVCREIGYREIEESTIKNIMILKFDQ